MHTRFYTGLIFLNKLWLSKRHRDNVQQEELNQDQLGENAIKIANSFLIKIQKRSDPGNNRMFNSVSLHSVKRMLKSVCVF